MTKNAYIHIPFCRSKCNYCSFISFIDLELKDEYLKALKRQITCEYEGERLNTLYFGGGTPSLLEIPDFKTLLNLFNFENNAEITVEVNPDSINPDYLKALRKLGINRLSIGAQTFDDEKLQKIGRRHNSAQILNAVDFAIQAGLKNISLDFIYGLPNQGIEDFLNDLKTAVDLNIQHISLYGLKIDKGCYFYENPPLHLPPDLDLQAEMYLKAIEFLKNAGFEHYEISNFAKIGGKCFESKHNLNYWENNSYYGFGCVASGYIKNVRYTNEPDLQKYIQNPLSKSFKHELSNQEILEEAIFLGFRKIAGINIDEINKKFGINFEGEYKNIINKYKEFFIKTENGYALNTNGILISNEILSEFICD